MFCTNCGKQFEGNFCPNCGAPAHPAARATPAPAAPAKKEYPAPPLGTFRGFRCTVTVGRDSIIIDKDNSDYGKHYDTHVEIAYADIATVYVTDPNKDGSFIEICIRTIYIMDFPFVKDNTEADPFCLVLTDMRSVANRIYEFLKAVAAVNNHPLPLPEEMRPVKRYMFQDILKYTETLPEPEPVTAKGRIRQNKANGIACCPKCGSTSLSADKGGFSLGKAAVGSLVAWPVGLAAGALGSGKTVVTCLNCGHKWKA